jgi:tetrahydromethanopterin S-methyltransferase subunit C
MRGRVLALQAIVFLGSTPIGGPILGWICDALGARAGLLIGGLSCFAAVAWGVYAVRRMAALSGDESAAEAEDDALDVTGDARLSRA